MGKACWLNMLILIISLMICVCSPENLKELSRDYLDEIINHVNLAGAQWEAGHNFDEIDQSMIQHMVGTEYMQEGPDEEVQMDHIYHHDPNVLPPEMNHAKEFDGIQKWHYCPSVREVKNQGKCASDWASTPVSVITDRLCIFANGTTNVPLSPHEPLSCCKSCGWGCRRGYPQMVYKQFVTKGLVSGGSYKSKKGCQPYEIKPCRGNFKKCFMREKYETPKCKPYCYNSNHNKKYADDRYKGEVAFRFPCPCCVVAELAKHGPLSATMKVYEDFLTYKKGVYHHVTGKPLGYLTVKLVGYNDTADPKYWVAVNSWGTKWGEKGLFKIRRMVDECMIEGSMRGVLIKDDSSESSEED